MSRTRTILLCLVILAGAAGLTWGIFSTEPKAARSDTSRRTAMLVDVAPVERGDFRPTIEALGTVRPERDVALSPRVAGHVIERAAAFTPGERVEKGDVLLRLDPADYRNALAQRRSELAQARADLATEEGRGYVAQQDYAAFADELPPEREALALRGPQRAFAEARVESAAAAVAQAELALARTTIVAPFDALVLARHVDVGSQVAPGGELGRLVGVEAYWVEVTVPLAKLRWIAFPEGDEAGAPVELRSRTAWPEGALRTGRVHRLVGALNDETRLARVLVEVSDPLGHGVDAEDAPTLMIGSVLEARIEGKPLEDVVRLDRDLLRSGDSVWVADDGRLRIVRPTIAFRDEHHVFISSGLEADARVVTTGLSTVVEGAELRLRESDAGNTEPGAEPRGE